jgi:hypothetical protein
MVWPASELSQPDASEPDIPRGRSDGGAASNYPFANILSYQYDRGNFRGLILTLFNYVEADVKSDHLVIFFDENERVKYYGSHKGTEELQ